MPYRLRIDRLREAAAAAGDKTGTEIAQRTGLSQPQVSRLLNGKSQPKYETVLLLRATYDLAEGDLIEPAA
ncbi:helix-turn-helix domain-containing protein [Streptomyces sp. NPDC058619]|uniref:helix-turn-helix domain-containing protein n=1 Tax=unclassified Streptomyces TaxID=2593676 RepID=UPI003663B8EE